MRDRNKPNIRDATEGELASQLVEVFSQLEELGVRRSDTRSRVVHLTTRDRRQARVRLRRDIRVNFDLLDWK